MDFDALFAQVIALLQREQRISYRVLKRRFNLSEDDLADLQDELIYAKKLAVDEENRVLVWAGGADAPSEPLSAPSSPTAAPSPAPERDPFSYTPAHLAEKILTSRSALEGERKQVTVLFCDLAHSTAIAERIGPEPMHTLLNRFFALALNEVHRYEGTINQFLGDGFMALFGAPIAHEDHARRGVLAALALQHALQEADPGHAYGVTCAFRMGLNSGLVVVGSIGDNLRMDYSAIGDTTNLAARLQQVAEPGTMLVSAATGRLVQGDVRLEALQPVEVKGKTEPVPLYKVIGTLPRRSPIVSRGERTLSPFVGRERELATLEAVFAQVEAGQGQVVGVVAEAGSGKSRLLYEFRQRLADKQVTYLEGRCLSYGSSMPYHPIIDVVRHNCGVTEADNPETSIAKVRWSLHEVGMDADACAPYLLHLLGVREGMTSIAGFTPEAIRTRTFDTLRQMSLQGSQRRPLIFEVEDLHWTDKTSEDYLASLVESLAGASILLLTTYRPGYQPPWLAKSYATQIALRSLAAPDAVCVVQAHSPYTALPDHLAHMIIAKAEGNPFFLEELTRTVVEQGEVQAATPVPDTIQGVLMARIDRLSEQHKRVLQTAAVLGREFSPILLKKIWDGAGVLEPLLLDLRRLEFLFERTGGEDHIYVFKHALTQDVAYESLLTARRQALHAAAGQAFETLYADHLEDAHAQLAYHYARTDHAAKAVAYLSLVAEKAARGYAHAEAVASFATALAHAERLPGDVRDHTVIRLAIAQAESLFWAGQRQTLIDLFLTHQERLDRLHEPALVGRYYWWLGFAYAFLGHREHARQSLQRALDEGTQGADAVLMGRAHLLLAQEMHFAGALQEGIVHGQHAVSLLEATEEPFWFGMGVYVLALLYNVTGACHRALEMATRVHAIGATLGDRRLQTNALLTIGWSYTLQGGWDVGIEALQQALSVSPDAFESAWVLGLLGYAYMEQGNVATALPILERALLEAQHYRSRQVQCMFQRFLSEAYLLHNEIAKSRTLAQQGLALGTAITFPLGIGAAQRTLGRIAHITGDLLQAQMSLHDALTTFESIQARYELARTRLDLAALAHTQSNQDTATEHLSTAYAWFQKLQLPRWVEKTEQLAHDYGVTLTEVPLEEWTEGEE